MKSLSIFFCRILMSFVILSLLSACGGSGSGGGDGGGTSDDGDLGSDSGSGDNINWPGSIVGERIEFTVVTDISSGISPGMTVVYDFSVDGQVRGTNPSTGQVLTPSSYDYSYSGTNAVIRLNYDYTATGGGTGYEEYILKGEGSILQGTYEYEAVVTYGTTSGGRATGRYRIIIPSVSVVEVEGIEPLSGNSLMTLENLRFVEGLEDFAIGGGLHAGYIALRQDGSIVSYSARPTLPTQCNNPPCPDRINPILLSPQGSNFTAINSPSLLAGHALTDDGDLIMWGGEPGVQPQTAEFVGGGKVRDLIGYKWVLMEDGTIRAPLCVPMIEWEAECTANELSPSQQHLSVRPEVSNIRYAYNTALVIDDNSVVHHFKWVDGVAYSSPTPTGLPDISIAKISATLIIALSTSGELLAWDSDNLDFVEIPDSASSGIVDFEVALTSYEPRRYHVAAVKSNGAAVLWQYDENLILLSSEQVRSPGTSRYVRMIDLGRFGFIQ